MQKKLTSRNSPAGDSRRAILVKKIIQARAAVTPQARACFQNLYRFCLFIGQPRSGHSVIGTLLNAHPEVVVSHNLDVLGYFQAGVKREDLMLCILYQDRLMTRRKRIIGGHSYDIKGGALGCHDSFHIIGDKRAGATSRHLARTPGLLSRFSAEIGLPLSIIHHIRNPWDNISSIFIHKYIGRGLALPEVIEYYFYMLKSASNTVSNLPGNCKVLRLFHEELIATPEAVIKALFSEFDLNVDSNFLEVCTAFVHPQPRKTRYSIPWTKKLIRQVAEKATAYEFLREYSYDD